MKVQMGKGRRGITPCGGCSTIELLPRLVEQAGLEPTTDDNPQLRPIKVLAHSHKADKKATVGLPGVLRVAPPSQATDWIRTGIAGSTRTHNLRPAESASARPISTDKRRTGN